MKNATRSAPWYIRFNNPLDPEMFEEGMVTIDPILPGAVINISGNSLTIKGASVGNTSYHVNVSGEDRRYLRSDPRPQREADLQGRQSRTEACLALIKPW